MHSRAAIRLILDKPVDATSDREGGAVCDKEHPEHAGEKRRAEVERHSHGLCKHSTLSELVSAIGQAIIKSLASPGKSAGFSLQE